MYFQNVFPKEFGPTYQKDLCTLMWIFLSRLENCLPLQSFQQVYKINHFSFTLFQSFFLFKNGIYFCLMSIQVAPMLGKAPSFLEDFVDAVLGREEFKLLLQNQKDQSGVDHHGKPTLLIAILNFFSLSFYCLGRRSAVLQPGSGNINWFTTARLQFKIIFAKAKLRC